MTYKVEVIMCTRVLFSGSDNLVITGRSMDWVDDPSSNLWSFPRGMKREGGSKDDDCIEWTSKYGCLGVSFYDKGLVDGINEVGLVVNALYLVESDYGTVDKNIPTLSILSWTQYFLDNYGSVEEAVNDWMKDGIQMVAPVLPMENRLQLIYHFRTLQVTPLLLNILKGNYKFIIALNIR